MWAYFDFDYDFLELCNEKIRKWESDKSNTYYNIKMKKGIRGMWVYFDNEDFANECIERMCVWEKDPDLLDIWREYYYELFINNYSDDAKLDKTINEIVDNDFVNYKKAIILNHDYHKEPELALKELADEGYSFDSIEDLTDYIVHERDGKSFIMDL